MTPRAALVVFAKPPLPGAVKTRMTPPLRPDEAAGLYDALLRDALELCARAARVLDLEPQLAVHPASACPALAQLAPSCFRVVAQRGADLGRRMEWAVAEAAAAARSPVLLRGSDSPTLDVPDLAAALDALAEAELVLRPDRDGGYQLVGLRAPVPGLFDHPMSTPSVLADTRARARARGLRLHVLEPSFDLDRIEDLRWLADARAARAALPCPRTLAYADAHDLWRHLPD